MEQQQQQSFSRPVTGYPAPAAYSNGHPPPQSNTAYPYPAPPQSYQPNPYPYAYGNYAPPQPNPRATVFRRFLIFMIAISIIFGTIVLTVWIVLRPRIPEFRVDSASISNFTVSPSLQVTGVWKLGFQVLNPNKKMRVSYDDIQSSIFYKSQFLAQTLIPPFDQGTRNQTAIGASYSAEGSYVGSSVLDGVNRDRSGGTVKFNARILADVAFRAGGWRPRRRLLRVLCLDLPIGISANSTSGKLVGGAKECSVDL